jgi:hypothetical protein
VTVEIRRVFVRWVATSALAICAVTAPLASDPPDSQVNPQSGSIETVDSYWTGSHYRVRHVINPGDGQLIQVSYLTTGSIDDNAPRVAISAAGDTWAVWWRDDATDEVLIRKRTYSSGTWGAERLVSNSSENSQSPQILHDGTKPWVAYHATVQGGTKIAVAAGTDSPDPWDPLGLRTTTYAGDVDVLIHFESSHLWVTWVDSASNVGWCEYDYATSAWSSPSNESYASDNVTAARGRIRAGVLGN